MAAARKFDRYMVQAGAGRHVKFRRLTVPERHAFFVGVLSIAAQSPIRGCLLVGNLAANAADIAAEADVPDKVAETALAKLREVGVIFTDDELGCERVHDFDQWNPAPKNDATNADRQKRYRDRLKASRNAPVTPVSNGSVTPPEVEGEEEGKEANASSSAVADTESREDVARLCHLLGNLIVGNDPKAKVAPDSKGWHDACRLLLDRDGRSEADVASVIRWCQADSFWRANILSMPKLRDKYAQLLLKMNNTPAPRGQQRAGWSTEDILAAGRDVA